MIVTEKNFKLPLNQAVELAISMAIKNKEENRDINNIYYIVDKPGAGKTSLVKYISEKNGLGFGYRSMTTIRYEMFTGIPDIVKTKDNEFHTVWSVPEMISILRREAPKYKYYVYLLDDFHIVDQEIQKVGFELFTYNSINNYNVPNNVIFILAGNYSTQAGTKILNSAIRNRLILFYTKADVDYWIKNYAIPNNIKGIFFNFFKIPSNEVLFQEEESVDEGYGSPRSWSTVFHQLSMLTDMKHPDYGVINEYGNYVVNIDILKYILQGSVSNAAAAKFISYYELYSKVDLKKFFSGKFTITNNISTNYLVFIMASEELFKKYIEYKKNKIDEPKYKQYLDIYSENVNRLSEENEELTYMLFYYMNELKFGEDYSGLRVAVDVYNNLNKTFKNKLNKLSKFKEMYCND